MARAFYDGNAIFGLAVKTRIIEHPTASQVSAFFGVEGQFALYGGSRGRVIEVEGVLISQISGFDLSDLNNQEALIRSYRDGIGRVFTDTKGVQWPYVILRRYAPEGSWRWAAGGYPCQPYKAYFDGML